MRYFPAFLDLRGKKAVVVGGGPVAERKAKALIRAGALVTVVSPRLTAGLSRVVRDGRCVHRARKYRRGDLRGAILVAAATDDAELNARIARDAPGLVNVADSPERSSFIVPSVCSRGDLLIAVSTSGTSPALAAAIRQDLEARYGPEIGRYLKRLRRERARIIAGEPDPGERRRLLKDLGSAGLLSVLQGGEETGSGRSRR